MPQNNYAHDEEWCNTCNAGHFWLDCPHALEGRRKDVLKGQLTIQGEVIQHDKVSQQGNPNTTLMNFNEDEAIIAGNFDPNQVWRHIAASTSSKAQAANDQQQTDKYVPKGQQGQQAQAQKTGLQPPQQQKESVVPKH